MKQYFAKYLPVEGEIKKGDKYICDIEDVFHKVLTAEGDFNYAFMGIDNSRKVKLFLCSRDIQVGDEFYHDAEFYSQPEKRYNYHPDSRDHEGGWDFKIIGKISSKATWVKEGDEFDESQIKLNYRKKIECLCSKSDSYSWWAISNGCSYEDIDNYNRAYTCGREIDVVYEVELLGPCGHFH